MLNLLKIAVTGGFASGKSTVCNILQELNAYVVSADVIAHQLLNPQTDLGQKIVGTIGSDILQNETINRKTIADKVFKDQTLLLKLEQLLHPQILSEIKQEYLLACKQGTYRAFVAEMPLLFEIEAEDFYDVTLAVVSDFKSVKERIKALGYKSEEYKARMDRQLPVEVKAAKAHYTINNNGTIEDLRSKVLELSKRVFIYES